MDDECTLRLIGLWDSIEKCRLCFKEDGKSFCVGVGNLKPIIMTIGYHPYPIGSQWEKVVGKPNMESYDKMLHAIGITKDQVWATNCVKCAGVRTPGIPNTCKKNLEEEIDIIQPKLIITLGEQAFHALTDDLSEWIPNKEYKYKNIKLITMVSPQTITQNPRYERYWGNAALVVKQHLKQPSLDWW